MTTRRSFLTGLSGALGGALCGRAHAFAQNAPATFIGDPMPAGRSGYVLIDADSGAVLEQRGADDLFIPASLAKIPTSLAALHVLDPRERLSTRLMIDGVVDAGVLNGDLHLVGGGDPSLDTEDLFSLSEQLRTAGIHQVSGRFFYDGSALPQSEWLERSQPWQAAYNPSLGGLNLNFNRVQLKWIRQYGTLKIRGAAVSDGKVARAPSVRFRIRSGGPHFAHETLKTSEVWSLSHSILRKSGSRWLPVRRPGAFAAGVLQALCSEIGIVLPKPEPLVGVPAGHEVASHQSGSVFDLVHGMLKYSTNLTAEALGTATGRKAGIETIDGAARHTASITASEVGEIGGNGWNGFSLANHSGLSVQTRATPRQIAFTLREASRRYGESYVDLLNDRSLRPEQMDMPRGSIVPSHRITAKTGTMHFVRGFAGYLRAGSRNTVFAFMASDDARRAALDAAFTPYADFTPRGSRQWLRHARAFEVAMLKDWIYKYSA